MDEKDEIDSPIGSSLECVAMLPVAGILFEFKLEFVGREVMSVFVALESAGVGFSADPSPCA